MRAQSADLLFGRGDPGYIPRVLIESRPRAAEAEPEEAPAGRRSRLTGVRSRVLLSFLALLVLSTAASVLVLRQVLLSRIDDRIEDELTAELEPLTDLESGQPGTGEAWPSLESLFDAFLTTNTPPADGVFAAFSGDRL